MQEDLYIRHTLKHYSREQSKHIITGSKTNKIRRSLLYKVVLLDEQNSREFNPLQ
jgi:hypothetical protein